MSRAFLVGGAGFIGRRVLAALPRRGKRRRRRAATILTSRGGAPRRWRKSSPASKSSSIALGSAATGASTICARRMSRPSRLAAACSLAGVRRLVHVSAWAPGETTRRDFRAARARPRALRAVDGLEVSSCGLRWRWPRRLGRRFLHRARRAAIAAATRTGDLARSAAACRGIGGPRRQARARAASAQKRGRGRPGTDDDRRAGAQAARLARPEPARFVPLPRPVLGGLAWLNEIIEVGPGDRELVELLERGNVGDPAGVAAALGRGPRSLAESLALSPATPADLWRARPLFRSAVAAPVDRAVVDRHGDRVVRAVPACQILCHARRSGLARAARRSGAVRRRGGQSGSRRDAAGQRAPRAIGLAMLALLTVYSFVGLRCRPSIG